jgi:hypothetical protein
MQAEGSSEGSGVRLRWVHDWGVDALGAPGPGMAHHGVAATSDGRIVTFDAAEPMVLIRDSEGRLVDSWPAPVTTGHGMRVARHAETESLWVADNGDSWVALPDGTYGSATPAASRVEGAVVQLTLDGEELMRLPTPEHPAYERGSYCPTDVAIDEPHRGGHGDIWVADGYGQSLVHHYDADGRLLNTITGEQGAGRFVGPHAVHVDHRGGEPEIYIADRENARIQVFSPDGTFRRVVGVGTLISPGGFACLGDELIVAELDGRLAILGRDDTIVAIIGHGGLEGRARPGWPNSLDDTGTTVRPTLTEGVFNTPHGITTDAEGNVYVSEWVIGGRLIKLERVP